ncbi:MAG: matrixin family metalloprotease [Magnetococcales bacterium]|nr:matrixin family metalloprotease [Magnetococcales bacterium]
MGDSSHSTEATFYQTALHEIGHAIGLASDADPTSIMYYQLTQNNRTLDGASFGRLCATLRRTELSAVGKYQYADRLAGGESLIRVGNTGRDGQLATRTANLACRPSNNLFRNINLRTAANLIVL